MDEEYVDQETGEILPDPPGIDEEFDPSRYLTKISGADYLEVKWRLVWLRHDHPDAVVETDLKSEQAVGTTNDGTPIMDVVFKAAVSIPGGGYATGWGSESSNHFRDFREKAETKALGRALAALGYGTQFAPDIIDGIAQGRPVDSPVRTGGYTNDLRGPGASRQGQMGQHSGGGPNVAQRPVGQASGGVQQRPAQPNRPQGGVQGGQRPQQQQNQGPRNPNEPASERQVKYMMDLMRGLGFDGEALDWASVTKGEANRWIDAMQAGVLPNEIAQALGVDG